MTLGEQLFAQGKKEGLEKGLEKGRVQERAAAVLCVLQDRGVAVSEATQARILACADMDLLGQWLHRPQALDNEAHRFRT